MAPEDMGNLVSGTSVAATIHALAWPDRHQPVRCAGGAKFSGLPEWKEAMRSVAEQVQRMSAEQQAEFGRVVAAMRQGTPDDAMTAPVSDDGSAVPQPPAGRCPRCGSSPTSARLGRGAARMFGRVRAAR